MRHARSAAAGLDEVWRKAAVLSERPGAAAFVAALADASRAGKLRLSVLSETVTRVLGLIDDRDVDFASLVASVEADPALTTKVMGVAHSSYFQGATPPASLAEAMMRIGLDEVRTIVLVVALRSTILRSSGLGEQAPALFRHCLLAGLVAEELLGGMARKAREGMLYGLLHDVGRIAILSFADTLDRAGFEEGPLESELVDSVSAILHEDLGALVLQSWGFSTELVEAVRHHHRPTECSHPARELARCLFAADLMAHRFESGWPDEASREAGMLDLELAEALAPLGLDFEAASELAAAAAESLSSYEK